MRLVYVPVTYLSLLVGWGKYINDTKSNSSVFRAFTQANVTCSQEAPLFIHLIPLVLPTLSSPIITPFP